MKKTILSLLAIGFLAATPALAVADQVGMTFGGDAYAAGQTAILKEGTAHDAFLAGYNVSLSGPVSGNAHLGGFNVVSDADVGGNIYVAGFSVTIAGTVKRDVTAAGNMVLLKATQPIPGNVRLAGANVIVDSEIDGSLLVSGSAVTLNTLVKGDFSFYGETLSFGPNARIEGAVLIQAPKPVAVPPSVAPADRVKFTEVLAPDYPNQVSQTAETIIKSFWFTVWLTALWWLLLLVVGAAVIALSPGLVDRIRGASVAKPWRRIGLGLVAFAAVIGLVPLFAFTLVGILLIPFVLIFIAVACSLAYVAGLYFLGLRIVSRFAPIEALWRKYAVLAISLVIAGLVTMVPLVGWFVGLALVAFGLGLIATVLVDDWGAKDARLLAASRTAGPL